jgi:serine/threonine-protein kinase
MIGQTLGRYRLLEEIGSGGMGVVYRARDLRLERDVALKVLPAGMLADDGARKRFRREALALSQLNHPNIATVHDFDTQDGVDFLVLEHIEGENLDARLARGALPERDVAKLGAQLAAGLEAAHQRGVVHRDLKPGNLRVTPDGRLKVLDFGLARLLRAAPDRATLGSLTEAETVVGTLPYMAPEQLTGEKVDARADLYAAGAVLYELATGRRPFAETQAAPLMYAIVSVAPDPPSTVNRRVSADLESAILKALEKDPERRYQSARELRVDLERVAAPTATTARLGHRRPTLRVPVWAVAAVVLVVAVVVALNRGPLTERIRTLGGAAPIRSLAVLPLENLSRDPEQAYFADGMTEELSTRLAKIAALRVIAHGSVVGLKERQGSLSDIARALKVSAVLRGSVRQDADRVRITVQLVQVATGKLLWAESYERGLRDVLALQSEVATAIAREIQIKLTPQEQARLAAAAPVEPEAYKACLKGRYAWSRYTQEGFRQAEAFFRHAIEIDPTYAPAWAGLADAAYGTSSILLAPNVAIPRARAAAEKALALDETLPEAHTSVGIVKMVYDWDWVGAEREFDRAIALKPGDANARLWKGHLLGCVGRSDEGLAELRKAIDLDPLSSWISANVGWHLYFARRYDQALEHLQNALQTDPTYYIFQVFMGLVREQKGDHSGAVAALEQAVKMESNNDNLAQLAHAYGTAGRRADAERTIAQLLERRKQGFVPAASMAVAYAGLGDKEEAFRWLERAIEDHSEWLIFLKVDPGLDPLRSDARYNALLRRVHLAP